MLWIRSRCAITVSLAIWKKKQVVTEKKRLKKMSYYRKGLSITNREQFLQPQGSWQFQYDLLSLSTHISSWQICENDPRLLGIRTSFFSLFPSKFLYCIHSWRTVRLRQCDCSFCICCRTTSYWGKSFIYFSLLTFFIKINFPLSSRFPR